MFKLGAVLAALAASTAVSAQSIEFKSPRPGTTVHRERQTVLTVQTPNNGTAVQEVSLVLSILPCPDDSCLDAGQNLGTLLYTGPFAPTGQPTPQQAFNVTIPAAFPVGPAELLATHFVLRGDGHAPYVQIGGEIVFVV
ncbi:hypothetical protein AAL_05357 [Moelleriella libera RCEF 2490]|uniref:Phosphatidylglycerol/phosphatidylinositol transfer protein n=1 Tax=Moelleriella libera RCEF 2490 TaxID=1081109 RepID=A0A166P4F1_9HYPO|nr:hypothetical protein AAL_05357 [Moelleriella libera RCEF 2490]